MVSLRLFNRTCSGGAVDSLEKRGHNNKYCDLKADLESSSYESEKLNLKL